MFILVTLKLINKPVIKIISTFILGVTRRSVVLNVRKKHTLTSTLNSFRNVPNGITLSLSILLNCALIALISNVRYTMSSFSTSSISSHFELQPNECIWSILISSCLTACLDDIESFNFILTLRISTLIGIRRSITNDSNIECLARRLKNFLCLFSHSDKYFFM